MNQDGVTEHTGFPNPATDNTLVSLDIGTLLVKHPASTFFMTIDSSAWERIGVFKGDVAIIDRSLEPKPHDLVVWWDDDHFSLGRPQAISQDITTWGVITSITHRYHV